MEELRKGTVVEPTGISIPVYPAACYFQSVHEAERVHHHVGVDEDTFVVDRQYKSLLI